MILSTIFDAGYEQAVQYLLAQILSQSNIPVAKSLKMLSQQQLERDRQQKRFNLNRSRSKCLSLKKGSEARGLRKQFFSEEKNQKTFSPAPAATQWPTHAACHHRKRTKVFWFFSSEKNCFLHVFDFTPILSSRTLNRFTMSRGCSESHSHGKTVYHAMPIAPGCSAAHSNPPGSVCWYTNADTSTVVS